MNGDIRVETLLAELIGLLNTSAPAEEFSKRLLHAGNLPDPARRSGVVELVRMAMAVRNRQEVQQQRERGMLAVSESAQDLSSRLDLDGLLHAIVVRARKLLGAHLAWLSIYDPEAGEFRAVSTDGALVLGTARMTAARSLGVAGVVMSTRMPFVTPNYLQDNRFAHDASLDDTFRAEGIAALVGVPLIWDGQVIGLLFVADRYHRTHDALSVSILSTLATHGAVAIRNARAFEDATVALHNAQAARAQVEHHTRNVQAAAEAHEQLTSLLARGASLSALCELVARLLGGNVLIVDEASQVISRGSAPGYAGPAAAAYEPYGVQSDAIRRSLGASRASGRSVRAFDAAGETCRVVAVIGGGDLLGAILMYGSGDLDEMSIRTLERSASVIGVVLLSQERVTASQTRDAAALLRNVLSFRQDDAVTLRDRAERFGILVGQPMSLLLIDLDALEAGYVMRRLRDRSSLVGAVLDEMDGFVGILCNTTRAANVVSACEALINRDFDGRYCGIQSRPINAVEELPALYPVLRRALGLLRRMGVRSKVVGQNEMALYSVLFETQDGSSLEAFLDSTIGPLIAIDEKKGSSLTSTLLCYFEKNQNARETASALGIHVNTVRQRLAAAEGILGAWNKAVRAQEVYMALRLWMLKGHERHRLPP